jgi:hypothetical protein
VRDLLKVDEQHYSMSTRAGRPPRFPLVLEIKAKALGSSNHSLVTYATLEKVRTMQSDAHNTATGLTGWCTSHPSSLSRAARPV